MIFEEDLSKTSTGISSIAFALFCLIGYKGLIKVVAKAIGRAFLQFY